MVRKKAESPRLATYTIKIDPSVFDMHISFPSEYEGSLSRHLYPHDLYHLTFAGTLCASSSAKVTMAIPVTIAMETSEDNGCKSYFSAKKADANLHFFIKREHFFPICDNIKDRTLKYIELAGDDLVRGSAAIGSISFLTSISDEHS